MKRPTSNEKDSKLRKDGRDNKDKIDNGIGIYKIDKPIPCFLSTIMLPFITMINSKKGQQWWTDNKELTFDKWMIRFWPTASWKVPSVANTKIPLLL